MRRLLTRTVPALRWAQRNLAALALLLTVSALGLCIYALILFQQERSQTILRSCQQQNQRHDGTIAQLTREYAGALHLPVKTTTAQLERRLAKAPSKYRLGFSGTVLLIDQLAPDQNCQRVLAKATKP